MEQKHLKDSIVRSADGTGSFTSVALLFKKWLKLLAFIYIYDKQRTRACFYIHIRLTLPYFACQAKKYSNAPKGWPTRQKLTQKMELPITFPVGSWIFSNGAVIMISGS